MPNDNLPEGVREVAPGPSVRWQISSNLGYTWDGYVFEDDPSDLAKFMRWLANNDQHHEQLRLMLWKA